MERFKVIFPTGYLGTNIIDDNIDINVVLENGKVYFGVLGTLENIRTSFAKGDLYYWSTDLLIVKDLKKDTIKEVLQATINEGYFESIFCQIGTILTQFETDNFDEIEDMNDIAEYIKKY
ncbi:MAG: hypothetical protein LUH22_14710 [Bacteroides sp.]|nr:hypothetical protein [Bacteroides sp.]